MKIYERSLYIINIHVFFYSFCTFAATALVKLRPFPLFSAELLKATMSSSAFSGHKQILQAHFTTKSLCGLTKKKTEPSAESPVYVRLINFAALPCQLRPSQFTRNHHNQTALWVDELKTEPSAESPVVLQWKPAVSRSRIHAAWSWIPNSGGGTLVP